MNFPFVKATDTIVEDQNRISKETLLKLKEKINLSSKKIIFDDKLNEVRPKTILSENAPNIEIQTQIVSKPNIEINSSAVKTSVTIDPVGKENSVALKRRLKTSSRSNSLEDKLNTNKPRTIARQNTPNLETFNQKKTKMIYKQLSDDQLILSQESTLFVAKPREQPNILKKSFMTESKQQTEEKRKPVQVNGKIKTNSGNLKIKPEPLNIKQTEKRTKNSDITQVNGSTISHLNNGNVQHIHNHQPDWHFNKEDNSYYRILKFYEY